MRGLGQGGDVQERPLYNMVYKNGMTSAQAPSYGRPHVAAGLRSDRPLTEVTPMLNTVLLMRLFELPAGERSA